MMIQESMAVDYNILHIAKKLNIYEIQALAVYLYLLGQLFLLVVTRRSEHWPNKRITYTLQKQINKRISKKQTEPQHYILIAKKKNKRLNRTNSRQIPRMYDKSRKKPQHQVRFWVVKPRENVRSLRLFLKLNYRTEVQCKNNHNLYQSLSPSKRPKDCMSSGWAEQTFST